MFNGLTFTGMPPSRCVACFVDSCVVVLRHADLSHVVVGELEWVDEGDESDVIDQGLAVVQRMRNPSDVGFHMVWRRHRELQVSENGRLKVVSVGIRTNWNVLIAI